MKKIISYFLLAIFCVVLVTPAFSLAQQSPPNSCKITHLGALLPGCTDPCVVPEGGSSLCGMCCLLEIIYNVTDWIFYILLVAVVLLVVIGGAMYMMSAGDAEKAGKGKSLIIYGIIGLALALVAKLIPSVVKLIMGMS